MQENYPINVIKKKPTNITTHQEREAHIKQWQESGMSMSAYSKQYGFSVSTLSTWVKASQVEKPLLTPVKVTSSQADKMNLLIVEIEIKKSIQLRVSGLKQIQEVIEIVKGLTHADTD